MAEKVLYRAWRPLNFDQVVGQDHIVKALRQAIINANPAHAYLFVGTRGTGKTSLAKIFARAVNCPNLSESGNPCNECELCQAAIKGQLIDIIEMDAASNNSVDDIRKLTDEVRFLPTIAKRKVYIIDEVHMLSTAAFNSLLKTLEEPPAHVIFILATTDPQRIPATIISRCQRYDFKRIKTADMIERLRLIADTNDIQINDEALLAISNLSEGALRDAISLLDQARTMYTTEINRDDILSMVGIVNDQFLQKLVNDLISADVDSLMTHIDELIVEGGDINRFVSALAGFLRNLLVFKTSKSPRALLQVPEETFAYLADLAPLFTSQNLIDLISFISELQVRLKRSENPRISLEVALIQVLQILDKEVIDKVPQAQRESTRPSQIAEPNFENKAPETSFEAEPESASFEEISETASFEAVSEATPLEETNDRESNRASESPENTPGTENSEHTDAESTDTESEPVTDIETTTETYPEDLDLEKLWGDFLTALDQEFPLIAILLTSCTYYLRDSIFVIEFTGEQREIYDKITSSDNLAKIRQQFQKVCPKQLKLELSLLDTNDEVAEPQGNKPDWVKRMQEIAKAMDIPLEDHTGEN